MEKIFNAAKIFIAGIFLCGIIFISGKASAAEINQEAMEIFRETVMQTSKQDNRVFHQDIYFVMPNFTGSLEFLGAIEKNSLNVKGEFDIWMVDDDGKYESIEKPFYLTQDNQNMVIYFQNEKKKWEKMTSPVAAANMVDMFATPDAQQLEKMTNFVKDVNILQESEKSRTLLVKIDGAKIFEDIKAEMEKDPETQKQIEDASLKAIAGYFENGFKNADIWYTWTVDKVNWQTTTMSFNLSNLVQTIASNALNDSTFGFASIDPIREMLETIAFYSEFKGYSTFLSPDAKAQLEIPKNVLKAKEVKADDKSKKK